MKGQLPEGYVVGLDIGGLGIDLHSHDAELARQLSRRYQDCRPANTERFQAAVQLVSGTQPNTSLLQQELRFEQGLLAIQTPGCQVHVDPIRMQGYLQIDTDTPLREVEYYLRLVCALVAFEAGGLLFHAAGVRRKGRAYIFFGYSGSGKTTVARLSREDEVLNDDLLLIMPAMSGWRAHATPFWNQNQEQFPAPDAPLAGLFRLVQDREVYLERMDSAYSVAEMVSSCPVVSADPSRSQVLLERCQSILDDVPAYRLHFLPDASFWRVIDEVV